MCTPSIALRSTVLAALLLAPFAGCSSPQGRTLFITLDRNEGGIRLTDVEPDPF